jgi:small conductance mechanosensitive channel
MGGNSANREATKMEGGFTPEGIRSWLENLAPQIMDMMLGYGLNLIGAIMILLLGWIASGWAARGVRRSLEKAKWVDGTLKPFFASVVRYLILIITVVAVLSQFGVQTTSLIALLGAAGLAVGLALQGTLSNVAAGVMLLFLRPFKIGDFIEVGPQMGTVKEIGLFTTELLTPNNIFISLPNANVWNQTIINYTRNPTRRFDLTVGIDYNDDIDKAIGIVRELIAADERILKEPEPTVGVRALGESSVDLFIRGFCNLPDFWAAFFDLQKNVKQAFDREGITIPFPQRTVSIREDANRISVRNAAASAVVDAPGSD